MASEAQRIMNLSLTKIVSSRNRKGGVSLHRNLLVASVLFKARDVYAAEMSGQVVIRDGYVYDRAAFKDTSSRDVETQDASTDSVTVADDTLINDEQVMETVTAVFITPSTAGEQTHIEEQSQPNGETSEVELESCKENIEPADSTQTTTEHSKRIVRTRHCRKAANKSCRKRKLTEVESAVLSITSPEDNSGLATKMTRLESLAEVAENKIGMECCELASSLSELDVDKCSANCKALSTSTGTSLNPSRPDTCENSYQDVSGVNDPISYNDISSYPSSYQSTFHSFNGDYCTSSATTDGLAFSLSHTMVFVSV